MDLSIGTILLLSFWSGFTYFARRFMSDLFLERPIIAGTVAGLILGDLQTGLIVGATIELALMGVANIGGGVGPNTAVGAILGVTFAVTAGLSTDEALLLGLAASILGSFFQSVAKGASTIFVSGAEKFARERNLGGIAAMTHLGNLFHFLANAIPVFLALQIGPESVESLMASIPAWLQAGIKVSGQLLPAFGFALLLSSVASTALMPYFFIGFMLAAYFQMGVLGIAVAGFLIAAIIVSNQGGINIIKSADEKKESMVSKADQRQIYWRSFPLQSAFSFDRMQAIGFTWGIMPYLKKIYGDTEELSEALLRHLTFFNTHMWIAGPIYALVMEMETRKAKDPASVEVSAIQAVKASLMGPLAGIGDTLFFGTAQPILGGIAASLALQGSVLGPIMFFVVMLAIHLWVRKLSLDLGFNLGDTLFERIDQESFQRFIMGANIMGLFAIGGLIGTWVNITTPLEYVSAEGAVVAIQPMLNNIFPKLLPLLVTLAMFYANRKGVKNNTLMLITLLASFVLGGLGILG